MLLLAAVTRACSQAIPRRRRSAWERPGSGTRFARNLFDLSVRPATSLDFAARCLLLVIFALLCHSVGYGLAQFVRAAPFSAAVLFGALFACAAGAVGERR